MWPNEISHIDVTFRHKSTNGIIIDDEHVWNKITAHWTSLISTVLDLSSGKSTASALYNHVSVETKGQGGHLCNFKAYRTIHNNFLRIQQAE